jgi:hypothetical protein|tara:strand:+ start:919 stop:1200 length:282 start_codon:yes stop_codon:yes gene_type:complete
MKVKDIVGQIEHVYGRKSHKYIISLMNDGLDEIAQSARANTKVGSTGLVTGQRWYALEAKSMIDVYNVEVLDDSGNWRSIPRATSPPEIGDVE